MQCLALQSSWHSIPPILLQRALVEVGRSELLLQWASSAPTAELSPTGGHTVPSIARTQIGDPGTSYGQCDAGSSAFSASPTLKLAGLPLGGKSVKVAMNLPTYSCAGTSR